MDVLIVEDNQDIAANIGDYLTAHSHTCDFAMDGISALHLALTNNYDVIVLDLMLPGMDGMTVCGKLRQDAGKQVPILMLTARDTLPDKLAGFDVGADDYLVKPFALPELLARLLAVTRRNQTPAKGVLRFEDVELDLGTFIAKRGDTVLSLNPACLKLLEKLLRAAPQLVRRRDLEKLLWDHEPPDSDALRTHLYTLRRHLDKPFEHSLLQTVHGIGYRLGRADENPS